MKVKSFQPVYELSKNEEWNENAGVGICSM